MSSSSSSPTTYTHDDRAHMMQDEKVIDKMIDDSSSDEDLHQAGKHTWTGQRLHSNDDGTSFRVSSCTQLRNTRIHSLVCTERSKVFD
jgi:hypothetical protein